MFEAAEDGPAPAWERLVRGWRWLLDPVEGPQDAVIARWLFLRALAAVYFAAFYALLLQVEGLVGPRGVLPAGRYLGEIAAATGLSRFWYAPTLLWLAPGSHLLLGLMGVGLAASVLAFLNLWPRVSLLVCFGCFLSFVAAAQDFSGYQSDGMLLEAGFLALFFAPGGLLPGWGVGRPSSRLSLWLLQWEWFRIYFESGLAKWLSGDVEWHNGSAMYEYYQNSPLPTWVGWYLGHAPRWFQRGTASGTLVMELGVVLLWFAGRRARRACFAMVTVWELGVILSGNYGFLNYLVLSLGILLLEDGVLWRIVPRGWRPGTASAEGGTRGWRRVRFGLASVCLLTVGYCTCVELAEMVFPQLPLPRGPVAWVDPFRIANQYGLFATMTRGRYEIEFQGSDDGVHWTAYPFRYKPQVLTERPRIYAPYQPRFDWNLWFASLGDWERNPLVPLTEFWLLEGDRAVLGLFAGDPFGGRAPRLVRAVLWRYWFTSMEERRRTGAWWRRSELGRYSPTFALGADGRLETVQAADVLPAHE